MYKRKHELTSFDTSAVEVARGIYYLPVESRFGKLPPVLSEFIEYLNPWIAPVGNQNFNSLGLTTQVPNFVEYVVDRDIEIIGEPFGPFYTFIVIPHISKQWTPAEYRVIDALVNFDKIFDGVERNVGVKKLKNFIEENNLNSDKISKYLSSQGIDF